MIIPEFATKEELFLFLKDNKDKIIVAKKAELKRADAVLYMPTIEATNKAEAQNSDPFAPLLVKAIINTTNILDSHGDVHIDGLWSKSLNENKNIMHLQEHKMAFDSIISDGEDLKAYAQNVIWKSLGFDFEGSTQALTFESVVKHDSVPAMYKAYKGGKVKNHSVGMVYVKMALSIDSTDKDLKEEKANWNKYFPLVANKEDATNRGWFWAVTEAKVIEGSAVPRGSNFATPTQSVTQLEPLKDTPLDTEPPMHSEKMDYQNLITHFKL